MSCHKDRYQKDEILYNAEHLEEASESVASLVRMGIVTPSPQGRMIRYNRPPKQEPIPFPE